MRPVNQELDQVMVDWQTVQEDFDWDGSLRDIYVTPASVDDWNAVYPYLLNQSGIEFSVDGVVRDAPGTMDASFFEDHPLLAIRVGRAQINFHFFSPDEIECDFEPREVTSQTDLDALLTFVKELGDRTNKTAVITPENLSTSPIVSYDPTTGEFQYHPPLYEWH